MNICSEFLSALVCPPKLFPGAAPEDFLGQPLPPDEAPCPPSLPRLLSAGKVDARSPWSFDIRPLDCFLVLYTKKGCGKLLHNGQVLTLAQSSLLFFDCRQRFRIDVALSPWEYQILFVKGELLAYYYGLLPPGQVPLVKVPAHSDIAMEMEFLTHLVSAQSPLQRLAVSHRLSHIAIYCITALLGEKSPCPRPPSYIRRIHDLFDSQFQEVYTLDTLAEQFGVNKYRLCREFKAAYQLSPLQYLNRQRIRQAASLLLATGCKIHEIGAMVGIENTSHFISLFKKVYGVTPLEYKGRMGF